MTFRGRDSQDLGPLPADVAELLARGSGHVDRLDPEVRARLRARLLSPALSGGGPGAAPAHPGAARAVFLAKPIALLLTTFALGMGSGAGLHSWLRSGAAPATTTPAQAPPPAVVPVPPTPAPQPGTPPRASTGCPTPSPSPRTPERLIDADRGLGRERALLDQARAALVGGDAIHALAALDRHRRMFPDGHLEEERDVLHVRALLAAGREKEAHAEATRFLRKHPASLFRPAVEEAIAEPGGAE
ncbi:MAG TPA: hypothetical protein VLA79_06695 [Polyangia bacterium]|nr:hypothetical protein [Polyangia bacterium]